MELRVGGKFRLDSKIGQGSFGIVYRGMNVQTGSDVAIKLEPTSTKNPQLIFEAKIYKLLAGGTGIPTIHWYGVEGDFNVLVMDLLGPSLEDLLRQCGGKLKQKTVLMLADQMLQAIEFVHSVHILHRDIKPDNFCIGRQSKAHVLHLIDFGLAKKCRNSKTKQHIPYREGKSLVGTARYASLNTHIGIEQSRRDDLEAVGYVLLYFLRGSLPWQGIRAQAKQEKYQKIGDCKQATPFEALCSGFPIEFVQFFTYCRSLGFEERPDYAYLRRLFKDRFLREGCHYDGVFDWTPSSSLAGEADSGYTAEDVPELVDVHGLAVAEAMPALPDVLPELVQLGAT